MRGRRLTPDFFNDDRCWAVCYSDDGVAIRTELTASEAMQAANEINAVARRRGERVVEVKEMTGPPIKD
jgi:hypothetical protein